MKIYNNGRVKTCGECCVHNVPLWCIEFKGADGPIFLCAKCLHWGLSLAHSLS